VTSVPLTRDRSCLDGLTSAEAFERLSAAGP